MTREEAIEFIAQSVKSDVDMAKVADAIKALEQEPCEDEYIKVPKKALKYRTAGMVAYNAEWLKNHFNIERVVICGAQQPCEDAISRQAAIDTIESWLSCDDYNEAERHIMIAMQSVLYDLPSVKPTKTGHWKRISIDKYSEHAKYWYECDKCGKHNLGNTNYCPNCGCRMAEPQESEEV